MTSLPANGSGRATDLTGVADYVELRGHSWYSFGAGASSTADLVERAAGLEYPALGLTDASNLCGAMEFSRQCREAGVHPIHRR